LNGKEMVLLVDVEMIIDVGEEILRELGYKVLPANSEKEALDVYISQDLNICVKPALARRDVDMQFSLLMNASLSITAS